jgi:hypothetical protein
MCDGWAYARSARQQPSQVDLRSYDLKTAVRACCSPFDLSLVVALFGREASRCREAGQQNTADTLGVLSSMLQRERDRRKNTRFEDVSRQERSSRLYRDYAAACALTRHPMPILSMQA